MNYKKPDRKKKKKKTFFFILINGVITLSRNLVVNGENAAYKAPKFSKPHTRTRNALIENMVEEYINSRESKDSASSFSKLNVVANDDLASNSKSENSRPLSAIISRTAIKDLETAAIVVAGKQLSPKSLSISSEALKEKMNENEGMDQSSLQVPERRIFLLGKSRSSSKLLTLASDGKDIILA